MNRIHPKVSVITITYAHEKYIEDTLRGVLMQQYDGPIEFIIANDNSPDQTDEVVKNFFDTHRIPENIEIKYTCHSQNKGVINNFLWTLKEAEGDYIALCEGDDYWTDPLKLQKQVDFLETNLSCNLVYHAVKLYDEEKKSFFEEQSSRINNINNQIGNKSLYDLALCGNFIQTPSVIFRNNINYPEKLFKQPVGDYVVWFLNGEKGNFGYLSDKMAVYRFSERSTWGKKDMFFRVSIWLELLLKLKKYTSNVEIKEALAQQSIEQFYYINNNKLGFCNRIKIYMLFSKLNRNFLKIVLGSLYTKLTK